MADSTARDEAPRSRRGKLLVHKFQVRTAWKLGIGALMYTAVVCGLVILTPFFTTAIGLGSDPAAPQQYIVLFEAVTAAWPALVALAVLAGVIGIFLTHRVAGPLVRLERLADDLAAGRIPAAVRVRKGDELHELAAKLNAAIQHLDGAVRELREIIGRARDSLRSLEEAPEHDADAEEVRQRVVAVTAVVTALEDVSAIAARFRLSDDISDPPPPD
jgi:methyl-accepting chemotaxis protein